MAESSKYNGLAGYRQRMADEKAARMKELARYRKTSTVEVIGGKKFRVVRIPDQYQHIRRRPKIGYRRTQGEVAGDLPGGTGPILPMPDAL